MPWGNTTNYWYNRASVLANTPAQSGVYAIFTAARWIYFGEGQDIRARLLQHVNGDNECITKAAPTGFSFELVAGADKRLARQNALIRELDPACNQKVG